MVIPELFCPRSRGSRCDRMPCPTRLFRPGARKHSSSQWSSNQDQFSRVARTLSHPDLVCVEGGAAHRRHRFGTGQRVNAAPADMGLVGSSDSAISTPRRKPSNSFAVSVVSPRMFPSVTASPSAIKEPPHLRDGSSRSARLRAPASRRLVETGVEILAPRARCKQNGCCSSAFSSIIVQWSGSDGMLFHGPSPGLPKRRIGPVCPKVELSVPRAQNHGVMRSPKISWIRTKDPPSSITNITMASFQGHIQTVHAASSRTRVEPPVEAAAEPLQHTS